MTGFTVFLLMICEPAGSIFARPDSRDNQARNNSLTFTAASVILRCETDQLPALAMELLTVRFYTFGKQNYVVPRKHRAGYRTDKILGASKISKMITALTIFGFVIDDPFFYFHFANRVIALEVVASSLASHKQNSTSETSQRWQPSLACS